MSSIRINSYWNLFGSLMPILIGLFTIPFLIENIGIERFGVLSLIWALIGYFSIFDFGIGRALTLGVASQRAINPSITDFYLIRIGLKTTLIAGVIGGLILALLSNKFSFHWLNASVNLRSELFTSILLTSLGIPFVTYTSGLKGVLEGYEEFKSINIIKAILGILNFTLPVLSVIFLGKSLINIVIALVAIRFIVLIWHFYFLNQILSLKQLFCSSHRKDVKSEVEIFKFGAWMTLSNILSPLMVSADRFVISYLLGASVVAYYTVPFDLAIRALIIPAAFTTSLFPRFSSLLKSNQNEARDLFLISKKKVFVGMLLICVTMALFSKIGLSFWINTEFADKSWILLAIISVGIFFNGLAQVPHTLLQASGNVRTTAIVHLIEFIFYIVLLFILLKLFGIIGAALTFLFRVILDYLILNLFANKALKQV
jgi:O-antigen/teichoic acid export membrane protein